MGLRLVCGGLIWAPWQEGARGCAARAIVPTDMNCGGEKFQVKHDKSFQICKRWEGDNGARFARLSSCRAWSQLWRTWVRLKCRKIAAAAEHKNGLMRAATELVPLSRGMEEDA